MPRISSFYGVEIAMHYDDHAPPHFHAAYAGRETTISLQGEVLRGRLPPRAMRLVREWLALHRSELWRNWNRARRAERLVRIAPLE